ncbi:MAG: SusC/RagA family TonB-linked outer membrane protein [Segetibacter sp.]
MRKLKKFFVVPLLLLGIIVNAQTRTVKGKVLSAQDNQPVSRASVLVKGKSSGTTTGNDGSFSLNVPAGNATLVISSVGFTQNEVAVANDETTVTVQLSPSSVQLNEVVVTALGVTKNKKTLNYSTQTVETKDLTKARETNIGNSLAGRVAGLDVVRSSQGVGSNVRIVLRGDRSFAGSSEALVIIDGIPGDLGSLNPDDIASMNVLKGSSASALYGSDAQNGAIIITTKKGVAGKNLAVSINSSFQLDKAVNLRDFQNVYAQGSGGNYLRDAESAWGPKMTGQMVRNWSIDPADSSATYALVPHPDNYQNFFSTGKTFTNGVAVSGGGEKIQSYFSYTNISGTGIIDNNKFNRHNFNFRVSGNITDKLSFDTKITYFYQKADNYVRSDEDFTNVNRQITRLPSNIDLEYARNHYQFINADGELKQNYWHPHSNGGENPFWVKNNVSNFFEANTIKGLASLNYRFLPSLSLLLRTGVSKYVNNSEDRRFFDTYVLADNGYYNVSNSTFTETNSDFLLSYNKLFGNLNLYVNAGGNVKQSESRSLTSTAYPLVNENVFTLNNAAGGALSSTEGLYGGLHGTSKREKQSLYASADISLKSYLTLSLTGRNDWSSTLPKDYQSYFFGSAGLTAVVSDMVTLPEPISFFKLRGSVAQTGNDPGPYQTSEYFSISPGGSIAKSSTKPADTLKPEITTSQEYGFDVNFFRNRFGFEFTYYKTNSRISL